MKRHIHLSKGGKDSENIHITVKHVYSYQHRGATPS